MDYTQEVDDAVAETLAAGEADQETAFTKQFEPENKAAQGVNAFGKWMQKLPRNVGVGMIDAGLNTSAFAEDVMPGAKVAEGVKDIVLPGMDEAAHKAVTGFRDFLATGSTPGDQITQGVAQFVIPFTGWAKALGVARGLPMVQNILRGGVAEVGASSSALDPHAGRLADLLELGQLAENKFGDALRAVAPDDSLVNSYINWMTEREGEGVWEGRFKNSVDSLVGSAAVAGLLKAGGSSLRGLRKLRGEAKPTQTNALPVDNELAVPEQMATRTYETASNVLQQRALQSPNASMRMVDLIDDLDSVTAADSPYRELVNKLKKQKLEGTVSLLSEDDYLARTKSKTSVGNYRRFASRDKDEVLLNVGKIGKSNRRAELPGYAALHELVHAGTTRSLKDDPKLLARVQEISDDTLFKVLGSKGEKEAKRYGFSDPYEFVAEAFSNLRFQNLLKEAGTWKEFVSTMGKVFGLTGASLVAFENVVQLPKEGSDA